MLNLIYFFGQLHKWMGTIQQTSVYHFCTGGSTSAGITKSPSHCWPWSNSAWFWQQRNQSGSIAEKIPVKEQKSTGCFKYQEGTLKFPISFFSWSCDIFSLKLYCLTSRHFWESCSWKKVILEGFRRKRWFFREVHWKKVILKAIATFFHCYFVSFLNSPNVIHGHTVSIYQSRLSHLCKVSLQKL